jgi:hypothetical protein
MYHTFLSNGAAKKLDIRCHAAGSVPAAPGVMAIPEAVKHPEACHERQ